MAADLTELVVAERTELADLLGTLDDEQWNLPSLCSGWAIRDVVAHMLSWELLSIPATVARFIRGRLPGGDANAVGVRELADRSPAELLGLLHDHLRPHGIASGMGAAIGLTDGVIHTQDIRRPLGRPRTIPAERLRPALAAALGAPTLPSRRAVTGVRLEADDLDWSHGDGPAIVGPAEAILLAIAGRRVALDDLDGPGLPQLRAQQQRAATV